jgi:hypothetical protein
MFLLRKPSEAQIDSFIAAQQDSGFSYDPLGMTRDSIPAGYTVDRNRVQLGSGDQCFKAAVLAIQQWKMFDFEWIKLCWSRAPIEQGSTVAVVVNHLGFWSMRRDLWSNGTATTIAFGTTSWRYPSLDQWRDWRIPTRGGCRKSSRQRQRRR